MGSYIQALRSDPIFRVKGYDICPRMKLDLGGEWLPEYEACIRMKIRCEWISPDTKSKIIERSIGIVEAHIKATLMSQNPPKRLVAKNGKYGCILF